MTPEQTVSLTLVRPGPSGLELFWARRCPERDFLGGFHAFFAGGVEPGDGRLYVDTPESPHAHLQAAALRECCEECGLLLTTDGIERIAVDERSPNLFDELDRPLATSRLQLLGWWTTPQWLNPTFSTAFYGLRLTADEGQRLDDLTDHLDPVEFAEGCWLDADEALRRWDRGQAFTTTPLRAIVSSLADSHAQSQSSTDSTPDPLPTPTLLGISEDQPGTSPLAEVCGGITMLPLKTATIPPATHTNCVIAGRRRFVVIDPGPSDHRDLAPLLDHLEERKANGDQCIGVVLTHHHRDHIGGVNELANHVDAPLMAHAQCISRLDDLRIQTEPLEDGDLLDIDYPGPLRALFTPGHAPGHLAFLQPDIEFLIGGDLVASESTIVIDPPGGHMGDYLDSLRRIRDLSPRALLPGHGQLITAPATLIDGYIAHRHEREQSVLDALGEHGPATPAELVPHVYTDAPRAVWALAARSLLAHLHHLVERQLATEDDGRFSCR